MLNKTLRIFLTTIFIATAVAPTADGKSTSDVWAHHIEAWKARDLKKIVSDYTDDSVLILNNEIFRGTSEIRDVFARLFTIFDHGKNRIDPVTIDGRIVFITWYFNPSDVAKEFYGTDTFVIENSKISVQTIASRLYDVKTVKTPRPEVGGRKH